MAAAGRAAGWRRGLRADHGHAPDDGLFPSPLNTATGLGVGSISLAFAFGQLWWGLTQPFADAMADKVGAGRVLLLGALLVAIGTFITPYMTSIWSLIFAMFALFALAFWCALALVVFGLGLPGWPGAGSILAMECVSVVAHASRRTQW